MALTKETLTDRIELLNSGHVQIRENIKTFKDGVLISSRFNRYVLTPDDNIDSQPEQIKNACNNHWTNEIIANFEEVKARRE